MKLKTLTWNRLINSKMQGWILRSNGTVEKTVFTPDSTRSISMDQIHPGYENPSVKSSCSQREIPDGSFGYMLPIIDSEYYLLMHICHDFSDVFEAPSEMNQVCRELNPDLRLLGDVGVFREDQNAGEYRDVEDWETVAEYIRKADYSYLSLME